MSEEQVRSVCEKAGSRLLQYKKARRTIFLLPAGDLVTVCIDRDTAEVHKMRGFLNFRIRVRRVCSWNLNRILSKLRVDERHHRLITTVLLDVLTERLARCHSVSNAVIKAATGALDPFEEVHCRIDELADAAGSPGPAQPGVSAS